MDTTQQIRGKHIHIRILSVLVVFCLLLSGCGKGKQNLLRDDTSKVNKERSSEENAAEFDAFMEEIFVEEITGDTLTLNYSLAHPEDYNITPEKVTLGEFSLEHMQEDAITAENEIARLQSFDYKKLNEEQQLTYDIVADRLLLERDYAHLNLYTELLGPTTGIQAQLPILLAEYNFRQEKDISDYLELLADVPNYFGQILDFEKEKAKEGLFMSKTTLDEILSQCEEFVENKEDNFLITFFDEALSENFPDMTKEQREEYGEKNKEAVLQYVLPAYDTLMKGLEKLSSDSKNDAGLAHFPKGKEYYEYLLKSTVGSIRKPDEIISMLEDCIKEAQREMEKLLDESPEAYYTTLESGFPHTDPEESISYLMETVKDDFPEIPSISYSIKYVNPSLEEHLSPAFYITPAVDDYKKHSIYINGSSDQGSLFTTLAHEGVPGHMYQAVYFNSVNDSSLRKTINISGYSEGWATYVEMYAYAKSEVDESVARLLQLNNEAALMVYARTDMGVNYEGWDKDKTIDYLDTFGFAAEDGEMIFDTMVAEPCNYMPYALGYLEIEALKEEAEEKLQDKFNLKDFHTFFLNQGACPFYLIQERMAAWMETVQ